MIWKHWMRPRTGLTRRADGAQRYPVGLNLPCRVGSRLSPAGFASMETITSEQPTVPAAAGKADASMDEPVVPRRSPLRAAIKTGRPQEWIKNVFVFAGLLFSGKFNQSHEVLQAFLTFVAFCFIST
jgi:hypothetical protein